MRTEWPCAPALLSSLLCASSIPGKTPSFQGPLCSCRGPVFICLRNSNLHLHPTPGHLTSLSGKPFKANQNCQPLFLPHRGSFHTIKHSPGHSNHDHGHLSTLDLDERAHQSCPVPRRQEKDSLEGARNKLRGCRGCHRSIMHGFPAPKAHRDQPGSCAPGRLQPLPGWEGERLAGCVPAPPPTQQGELPEQK